MSKNVAILLDLDNIKPQLARIETISQSYGNIVERRAFSNTPAVLTAYGGNFRKFGYRFELTPGLTPVSQEVDNLIIKTAWELVGNLEKNIEVIIIVSNDNDYAKLIKQLKTKEIQTVIIGNQIGNELRENATYIEILNEVMRPTYVGIDLGTTNTVMSLANVNMITKQWNASVLNVRIKDDRGSLVTKEKIPSSVRFTSTTEAEIGEHIKSQAAAFRDQTILAWKHKMGDSLDGKQFLYNLTTGKFAPEEAAAKVLAFCRTTLIEKRGEIQGVVITHPASYESDAIEATRKAAVLAGWQEEEVVLLSEPQAALYDFLYNIQKGEIEAPIDLTQSQKILVYDLGGGTLDITLHKVEWNDELNRFLIEDLAIGSRTRVGGDLVDELIADYILNNDPKCEPLTEPEKKKLRYELIIYAEKFKKLWGSDYNDTPDKINFKSTFQGNFLDSKIPIRYYISAEKMRDILKNLLCPDLSLSLVESMDINHAFNETPFSDRFNTFIVPVLEVLLKVKQSLGYIPKIDAILLNGGMTYFPPIKERLKQLFDTVPIIDDGHPDLAVARGAALFAAGAFKPSQGVNPTNIYLEVTEEGESQLRLLIAQGQKYPYKTSLNGFKLPDTDTGMMVFKAWVGMGNKPNVNTTLQRFRQVPVQSILNSNLAPNAPLNLEVEYTFDERLLLTLVTQDPDHLAKFKLEVSSTANNNIPLRILPPPSNNEPKLTLPSISRTTKSQPSDPNIRVQFKQWEGISESLSRTWNNGRYHDDRRELERKTANAHNRLDIVKDLTRWLEMEDFAYVNSNLVETQMLIATMTLSNIFPLLDLNNDEVKQTHNKFKNWIRKKFEQGLRLPNNDLYTAIGETPGKLFWTGFDTLLITVFNQQQHQKRSLVFLNSLGKCGQPTPNNLSFLRNIIQSGRELGHKEKAAWAIGRLLSPGQPEEWKASFKEVQHNAKFILQLLTQTSLEAQVALNLLNCLSQCVAWQITGLSLDPSIITKIQELPHARIPSRSDLTKYHHINILFEQNLILLPKMLNISEASSSEITQMQEWLLESVKG